MSSGIRRGCATGHALVEVDIGPACYEAFGETENVQIGERPDPAPNPDQMLVRTHAAGVGIWDAGIMRGLVGQASLPRIPGFEVAGIRSGSRRVQRWRPRLLLSVGVRRVDRVQNNLINMRGFTVP